MKRWASIHPSSGAILAISSNPVVDIRSNIFLVEAGAEVSGETYWWDGSGFRQRQLGDIALPMTCAEPGCVLDLAMPPGAWYMRTDGTIADAAQVVIEAGYKQNRFTLVGAYTGEATIDVVPAGAGMAAVRLERDRLLKETDVPFMVSDFPISAEERAALRLYRMALRDLPESQPGANMATVVWPLKPGAE